MGSFRFKHFKVKQAENVFKVGTDGVLLGAWFQPLASPSSLNLADWGAGTGLIGLMLAQRFPEANIDLIEADDDAFQLLQENCEQHKGVNQLNPIQTFISDLDPFRKWDVVVSNPPYFENSMVPTERLTHARHQVHFDLKQWIQYAYRHTTENGELAMILPLERFNKLRSSAEITGWYLHRITRVKGNSTAPIKRVLIHWTKGRTKENLEDELIIEKARHDYTNQYRALTRDFYLNF